MTPDADSEALIAVGLDYCIAHNGIRNEDDEVCDFYYAAQAVEGNEGGKCDFRQLYYLPPNDGHGT